VHVSIVALVCALIALGFSVLALRRTVGLRSSRISGVAEPASSVAAQPLLAQPEQTTRSLADPEIAALLEGMRTGLRHIAVVRFDAFDDVSGRQSFTAAILDDNGDGIVITSLHARTESRTLLKGISAGTGDALSPEEQQAVDQARGV